MKQILGYCKECGVAIHSDDKIPDYDIHQCPNCYYPNTPGDLVDSLINKNNRLKVCGAKIMPDSIPDLVVKINVVKTDIFQDLLSVLIKLVADYRIPEDVRKEYDLQLKKIVKNA